MKKEGKVVVTVEEMGMECLNVILSSPPSPYLKVAEEGDAKEKDTNDKKPK